MKRAETDANQVNRDLMLEQFDWKNWSEEKVEANIVKHWITSFEKDYFTRRDRNPKSETTWSKDYYTPFKKLPQDEPLIAEVLITATKVYLPDTRSKKRACSAYSALAVRWQNLLASL